MKNDDQTDGMIGALIDGKFLLLECLGVGGMGAVYKAHQKDLDRLVAIKFLQQDLQLSTEARERFQREATVLSRLRSANVAAFLGWGFWKNQPFIVMEFLEGRTLAEYLVSVHKLSWQQAFSIAAQICEGLQAIHALGAVHRDVSTRNVILCKPDNEVKLIDLGLACLTGIDAGKVTQTGALIGSPHYMSPEVCSGRRATSQSDIYSVGCILYEMISGRKALDSENVVSLAFKHGTEYPAPLREVCSQGEVPYFVESIVFKSIQKQTSDRYVSARQLKADLLNALRERLSGLPQTSWLAPQKTRKRASKVLSGAAVGIVCIALPVALAIRHGANSGAIPIEGKSQRLTMQQRGKLVQSRKDILGFIVRARDENDDLKKVENSLNAWMAANPDRIENSNFLYLAECYLNLSLLDVGKQDEVTRLLKKAKYYVDEFRPADDAQRRSQQEKRAACYGMLATNINDAVVARQSLDQFFAIVGSRKDMVRPAIMQGCLLRDAEVAMAEKDYVRAIRSTMTSLQNGDYFVDNIRMVQRVIGRLPGEFTGDKLKLIDRLLAFDRDFKHDLTTQVGDKRQACLEVIDLIEFCRANNDEKRANSLYELLHRLENDWRVRSSLQKENKMLRDKYGDLYQSGVGDAVGN
ncbi:MAG: serine/threonine protein kinase [Candidatus Obscuribacterales bacterium]|nr:serine/threonine protein kinase [Candidatus Obscuribacterales bacterium]